MSKKLPLWKDYELEVFDYFKETFPECDIQHNVKIEGIYSKQPRQVDILIEHFVGGFPVRIIVDAKHFNKKIDVKHVEQFIPMIEDVGAQQGLLVTTKGYSQAAINRAHYGSTQLDLDVLNFDELTSYQSETAFPYSGKYAIALIAPFGWVIDFNTHDDALAYLYQRGKNLDQAWNDLELMYVNIWHKGEKDGISTTEDLIELQNSRMNQRYTNFKFSISKPNLRNDDFGLKIREVTADDLETIEITGFIDFEDFIAYFVMHTKEQLKSKNLRKLHFVLSSCLPIEFNYEKIITDLKNNLENTIDPKKKSFILSEIAKYLQASKQKSASLEYSRLSFDTFPNNFENIKRLLQLELDFCNWSEASDIAIHLFKLDPKNPTVMQEILNTYAAYDDCKAKQVVLELISITTDYEALGNIKFHYAQTLSSKKSAKKYMKEAKEEFKNVFDPSHYVFKVINIFIKNLDM